MKVIKTGTPWWVGQRVKCKACGCEIELELSDRPTLVHGLESLGDAIACPDCRDVVPVVGNPLWKRISEE